jgi:hypothetical protein
MVSYSVTRWDLSVHQGGDDEGKVCRVILGITATDSVSGKSAYKDESLTVSPCVALDEFNTNAEQWIENTIGGGGWYLELQTRIASQLTAPVPAPAHEHPDFSKMTIGDGYSELPTELGGPEEEPKEEEDAEVVAGEDAPKEEEVPKPKKKAKKKAAPKVEEEPEVVEEG